jgi:hypothetical protein
VPCLVQMGQLAAKILIAEVGWLDAVGMLCHLSTISTPRRIILTC